jgi:RNA-binding protein
MPLTPKFKQQLKAKAHALRPIVLIGNNGLSENVNIEIDRALTDHELIKIRIQSLDRLVRKAMFAEICQLHHADLVQSIGNIAVLYRKNN